MSRKGICPTWARQMVDLFKFFTKQNPPSTSAKTTPETNEPTLPNELILQILEYLSLEQLILKARSINKTWNILATHRAKHLISSRWLSKVQYVIPLPPFYLPTLNTQFNLGLAGDFFSVSKEAAIYLRFESFSPLQEHLYWRGYYKSVLGAGRVVLPWRIVECSWAGETRGFEMAEGLGFIDIVSEGFEFALDVEEYIERRTRGPNECMERGRCWREGGGNFIYYAEGYKVTLDVAPVEYED